MDKQFQIKQRGNNTCMVDFVWHNCKGKKGFQKYTYQKLYDEMEVYGSASFPMMSAQELIDWAKACHPKVSIHAYDSTWKKFMKHISNEGHQGHVISLVFYIKDHHLYLIQDDRLKQIATKANYGATCQNSNGLINRVITSYIKIWSTTILLPKRTNQHY